MATPRIVQIRQDRLDKLEKLKDAGFDPYPSKAHRTHMTGEVLERFELLEGERVTISGRLMSFRAHGGLTFADVQDQSGRIQLFIRKKGMGEADPGTGNLGYGNLKLLDVGDFVEATGEVLRTNRGEISIGAESVRLLTKTLRPLPDKWAGLKDRERILRQRYLHNTMDPDTRGPFERFGRVLFAVRSYLYDRGFIEAHTPILQALYGGGTAKPFVTHLNALHQDMYLSISHELYLKRMIAAGFDKVFTIGRYFRNEGIDSTHHPEFSMIETMTAYENYEYNMDLVEGMFKHVAREVYGRTTFTVRGVEVDIGEPWLRVNMPDAVLERFGYDFRRCPDVETANRWLAEQGLDAPQGTVGEALFKLFDELIGPTLTKPTFVYGHPREISPLAKPSAEDPRFVERFEVVIGGMECGDNWSEQNDPQRLLDGWREAAARSDLPAEERHPMDYSFVEMLEYGMPPTTGIGPGIERMMMIFEETENIDDVIYFPLMRPEPAGVNAVIYGPDAERAAAGAHTGAEGTHTPVGLTIAELEQLVAAGGFQAASDRVVLTPRMAKLGGGVVASVVVTGLAKGAEVVVTGFRPEGETPEARRQHLVQLAEELGRTLEARLGAVTVSLKSAVEG